MDVRSLVPGYEILEPISDRGGQAIVYRARQLSIDKRMVAIKVYRTQVRAEDDRRGFLREVTAMRELAGHHNVVRLDRADVVDGWAFIVMELCKGSLDDQLRANGPFPPEQVIDIALRVCRALTAAHTRGILHRDLKPSNLLWTTFDELVVADFGIATLLAAGSGPTIAPGLGTPGYIAPELLSGHPATVQSDIYALGATLNTLLHGTAAQPGQVGVDPRIPSALSATIARATAADPAQRFSSVAELARQLSAGRAGGTAGPTVSDPGGAAGATLRDPNVEELAETWLRGVDSVRAANPQLRPAITVPTPSALVPKVGWWAVGVTTGATVLLGVVNAEVRPSYVAGAALVVLAAYALLALRVHWVRKPATAVLTCALATLAGVAGYFTLQQPVRPLPGTLAGVGAVGLLVAGATLMIASRQLARAQVLARQRAEHWALVERARSAFEDSGRAPSWWLSWLLTLPAVRLYRLDGAPFDYAAACGSRVVVFTVVRWHKGHYATMQAAPNIARNGQPYRPAGPDTHAVLQGLRQVQQQLNISDGLLAMMVITPDGATGDGIVTAAETTVPGLALATPETVTDRAGAYLAGDPYHIDVRITRRLLRLMAQ